MIDHPSKLFPCDCMGEGLTVSMWHDEEDISEGEVIVSEDKKLRDCQEAPFIQISFWEFGVCKNSRWSWWWRLKIAWRVFRDGSAWPDQVIMKAATAKNLAHHILYVIRKGKREIEYPPLVKEEPHSMFCFQHGGSAACEESNKKNKLECPKCEQLRELGIDEQGNKINE